MRGLADGKGDLDVVPTVAGQPVDLVDDDVVDVSLVAKSLEHLLQLGTIGLLADSPASV